MQDAQKQGENQKLPTMVQLMAGWPLILVIFGGVIGGLYGVVAYLINIQIYKSTLSKMNKILANLLCGMSAMSGWWFSAQWLQGYFA